jgi:hypothetical protein
MRQPMSHPRASVVEHLLASPRAVPCREGGLFFRVSQNPMHQFAAPCIVARQPDGRGHSQAVYRRLAPARRTLHDQNPMHEFAAPCVVARQPDGRGHSQAVYRRLAPARRTKSVRPLFRLTNTP